MKSWKYEKIAARFVELRRESPKEAADYAKSQVPPAEFKILSKFIEVELHKNGEYEPNEK